MFGVKVVIKQSVEKRSIHCLIVALKILNGNRAISRGGAVGRSRSVVNLSTLPEISQAGEVGQDGSLWAVCRADPYQPKASGGV
jgi:hypothetical protein